jgi:hypothetical protein
LLCATAWYSSIGKPHLLALALAIPSQECSNTATALSVPYTLTLILTLTLHAIITHMDIYTSGRYETTRLRDRRIYTADSQPSESDIEQEVETLRLKFYAQIVALDRKIKRYSPSVDVLTAPRSEPTIAFVTFSEVSACSRIVVDSFL